MADKVVIRAEDVGKRYGKLHALRDINLEVNRGEIFGLIGPDGAGKTTLFRLVATLLTPDSGSLTVLGHDVVKQFRTLRKQIAICPAALACITTDSGGEPKLLRHGVWHHVKRTTPL